LSQLLRHPRLIDGEGPQGFLLRLANANGLDRSSLKTGGVFFHVELLKSIGCLPDDWPDHPLIAYATLVAQEWAERPLIWNTRRCRCCPLCLQEGEYWRVGWEHLFFDVCPVHDSWLVDRCDSCGSAISWRRQDLHRCDCGHHFASSKTSEAPAANVLLANDLKNKFVTQHAVCNLLPLQGLSFEQAGHLIRLLGTYGQNQVGRLPQKIQNAGAMDVSWQVTSTAAEILNRWPHCFEHMLHGMLDQSTASAGQRFPARFGHFYALLYRRFAGVEFSWLRNAFENFVAEHWRGPIARRNTRLAQAMLARATWVPANHARGHLQVSASRLSELVRNGALVGEERLSETGRRFLVVRRDSMQALSPALEDEVDLSTASEMLGLTRARLRTALPQLFPDARKIEGDANRWAISRADVSRFLLICDVPMIAEPGAGQLSIDHVLRFWCCSEDEIATLLAHLRDGVLKPMGRLREGDGLSHLVIVGAHARQLIDGRRGMTHDKWTIPQVAEMLGIKQEVAYFLVRCGLLVAVPEIIGRREAAMVNREALDTFRARYVFARDLAKLHKTSARSLQSRLAEIDIYPAVSPTSGACRQIVYERTQTLLQLFPAATNQLSPI
jgi:hypothetical protein